MMKTNIIIYDDCLNFMKSQPDKCIDLCLTDPPYGIGMASNPFRQKHKKKNWDNFTPTKEYFEEIKRISKNQIIWGYNYFADLLGTTKDFIFWNKLNHHTNRADGELAYTSFNGLGKYFAFMWDGNRYGYENNIQGTGKKSIRVHPTQKPVELFSWVLENYSNENDIIFDPFAGSGTTAISCINMNRKYILVEKEKEYFDIINKRIDKHQDGNLLSLLTRYPQIKP